MDPEQHYGIIAMEPRQRLEGATLSDRLSSWESIEPLYETDAATFRVFPDEAYLWMLIEQKSPTMADELFVGFDMLDSATGDHRWPGAVGPRVPLGLEFVLKVSAQHAEVVADSGANPWKIVPVQRGLRALRTSSELENLEETPEGTFSGRWHRAANVPFLTAANEDGAYTPLNVIVRPFRISRDTTEYPAVGYTRGVLPPGGPPDGLWEILEERGATEMRIPWTLLNVTDPSSRQVLMGADNVSGLYRSQPVPDIRIVAAMRTGNTWTTLPGEGHAVIPFTWNRWQKPEWQARPKPLYLAMQRIFRNLIAPATLSGH